MPQSLGRDKRLDDLVDSEVRLQRYVQSDSFNIKDYVKRRVEYWQPVLYINRDVDFRICAKNACSSMKAYYSWLRDPDWFKTYGWTDVDIERAVKAGKVTADDIHSGLGNQAFLTHYETRRAGRVKAWQNNPDTSNDSFFSDNSFRICIKRDPIKRFVSAYQQIYSETAWSLFKNHSYNIDMLIDKLDSGEYWNEHTAPQSFWLGKPEWYDKIFDVTETTKCIQFIHYKKLNKRTPLPNFHLMKGSTVRPELTRDQISKVEYLYMEDYENGWY